MLFSKRWNNSYFWDLHPRKSHWTLGFSPDELANNIYSTVEDKVSLRPIWDSCALCFSCLWLAPHSPWSLDTLKDKCLPCFILQLLSKSFHKVKNSLVCAMLLWIIITISLFLFLLTMFSQLAIGRGGKLSCAWAAPGCNLYFSTDCR